MIIKSSFRLPHSLRISALIPIVIVYVLSILELVGWLFNIVLLESIMPQWRPMEIITAFCFIFAASILVIVQLDLPAVIRKTLPGTLAFFVVLVSLLTLYVSVYSISTGHESSLTRVSYLRFILSPGMRMTLLNACNFLLIGCVLFLLTGDNVKFSGIAHILIIPVSTISYFVPVSYILDIYPVTTISAFPIALNTGIAFCALCVAVLLLRPDTWLIRVFTSSDSGGLIARRLLPAIFILPVFIGWLRIKGERSGFFSSEEGVVVVAIRN